MGHFEGVDIYSMATLVDPRYRSTYFTDKEMAEVAKKKLVSAINAELVIVDQDDPEEKRRSSSSSSEVPAESEAKSGSIVQQIAKRIRLEKEQRDQEMEEPTVTAESLVEQYLQEPLQENKPLR